MHVMRTLDGPPYDTLNGDALRADGLDSDRARLRAEFVAMPALCLTVAQVARLIHVPVVTASQLLAALEQEGFLRHAPGCGYRVAEPFER